MDEIENYGKMNYCRNRGMKDPFEEFSRALFPILQIVYKVILQVHVVYKCIPRVQQNALVRQNMPGYIVAGMCRGEYIRRINKRYRLSLAIGHKTLETMRLRIVYCNFSNSKIFYSYAEVTIFSIMV